MTELVRGELTEKILGEAFEVHRSLGPGFLESVYEEAMAGSDAKELADIHTAIALSYLKATKLPVALLLNFTTPSLSTSECHSNALEGPGPTQRLRRSASSGRRPAATASIGACMVMHFDQQAPVLRIGRDHGALSAIASRRNPVPVCSLGSADPRGITG
jgi:hypothetical protein